MMDLYILGAGGFAKEVYQIVLESNDLYEVKAFIDMDGGSNILVGSIEIPVISEDQFISSKHSLSNVVLAIGVGEPKLIKKLAEKFSKFSFPNIIHPKSNFNLKLNKIGKGNIITSGVQFTNSIAVGDFNIFNLNATIGHDVVIGNNNVVNPLVSISGGVTIGDTNLIGVSATILQYKIIGNQTTVGATSLVTKNVLDDTTVIGVPAKSI